MFKFFKSMFAPMESEIEFWARKNGRTTPDELIAGHLVAKMAKDYRDNKPWAMEYRPIYDVYDINWQQKRRSQEAWDAKYGSDITNLLSDGNHKITYKRKSKGRTKFSVDGVSLNDFCGNYIIEAYTKLNKTYLAACAAAAKAKAEMEANEAKWNLYEKISGFTRDKTGALIAKTSLKACDGDCFQPDCKECKS